jgi:hypothetical protein
MIEYPRVASLTYRIASDEPHEYAEGAQLDGGLQDFAFRLRHRTAEFSPLVRFANEADARAALEPQLRAWELEVALRNGCGALAFEFLTAQVERAPPRPGVVEIRGQAMMVFGGSAPMKITWNQHPAPPAAFAIDECVATLGELYLRARETPSMLLYLAYSATTCLEFYYGGLASARKHLAIAVNVFKKVNELANTRGMGADARKFYDGHPRAPLSPGEQDWLMRMLEAIVRRAAAGQAGAPVGDEITLETMPVPVA